jgi:caa(3)-type oxidase subunit IV
MTRAAPGVVRILVSWASLLVLLCATAAVSRWHLGIGNLIASLGIAALKVAIVAWIFMGLRDAPWSVRWAASIGVLLLLVLTGLSALDIGQRARAPAPWQAPEQLAPRIGQDHARRGH